MINFMLVLLDDIVIFVLFMLQTFDTDQGLVLFSCAEGLITDIYCYINCFYSCQLIKCLCDASF